MILLQSVESINISSYILDNILKIQTTLYRSLVLLEVCFEIKLATIPHLASLLILGTKWFKYTKSMHNVETRICTY